MSKLDTILSKLPLLAAKAMPGHKFIFSMAYFSKDSVFQLTMSKDYGHQDGPLFFLSGSGATTDVAALDLLVKFQLWCNKQIAQNSEELEKFDIRMRSANAQLSNIMSESGGLINEAVDNQLP